MEKANLLEFMSFLYFAEITPFIYIARCLDVEKASLSEIMPCIYIARWLDVEMANLTEIMSFIYFSLWLEVDVTTPDPEVYLGVMRY